MLVWKVGVGKLRVREHGRDLQLQPDARGEVSESTQSPGSAVPLCAIISHRVIHDFRRILEYEKPNLNGNNKGAGCRFELWDCSGDQK